MQLFLKKNKTIRLLIFFSVVLFVAFLPISSFLFYIKNDAFINYFPPKFFMSESLHAGYLPLWNPYINFGIPQYADMNAGYWSPATWLIAGTVGYNAYSFTIEALLYILLGGLGMYKLSGLFTKHNSIRMIAGISFMCCGYNIGHLQHFNWLSGAAFLPWCLWSYIYFVNKPNVKKMLGSVLLFYFFIASAHPGLIIASLYFFLIVSLFIFFSNKAQALKQKVYRYLLNHVAFILALSLISIGIIAGYSDIIPHFIREDKPALESTIAHSSNIKTWISLLLPFSTVKNEPFFVTDISMRNSYMSLTLLFFFLLGLISKKNNWQKLFLWVGMFFLFLSAGIFKSFFYHYFPLIGYVRLGGEFRIFAILSFIIVALIQLDKFWGRKEQTDLVKIKWLTLSLIAILSGVFGWAMYNIINNESSFFYQSRPAGISSTNRIKFIIDALTFYDTLVLQSLVQIILLGFIFLYLRKKNMRLLKIVVVADVIIASFLNIPFTGAGKTSLAHVQSVLDKSPKGIPIPPIQAIGKNDTLEGTDNYLLGYWNMYNKQIGTLNEMPYPIQLKNMRAFFDKVEDSSGYNYADKPFLYGSLDSTTISIIKFSPNRINLKVETEKTNNLIFLQNYYPHWYYKDDIGIHKINKEAINFMSIPIRKDSANISLIFNPGFIKTSLFITLTVFLLYILVVLFYKPKQTYPS